MASVQKQGFCDVGGPSGGSFGAERRYRATVGTVLFLVEGVAAALGWRLLSAAVHREVSGWVLVFEAETLGGLPRVREYTAPDVLVLSQLLLAELP